LKAISRTLATICAAACSTPSAEAQDLVGPRLQIELNAAEPAEGACKLSFVIVNGNDANVSRAVFEAVLFDKTERIDRLTLFDFGELPAGRPRVRQFVLPELDCASLGRVLINGAETCEAGETGTAACTDGLELKALIGVELIG